jgi:hypothetical protein
VGSRSPDSHSVGHCTYLKLLKQVLVKQGLRGYPIVTIAFYDPTADLATKIVVAIVHDEVREPDTLERWFSEDTDVRTDLAVGEQVLAFLKEHAAKSVIVTDGLIDCLTKKALDYPDGKSCPECPYWPGATASPARASSETTRISVFRFGAFCRLLPPSRPTLCGSELCDSKARDYLEVANIDRDHGIA